MSAALQRASPPGGDRDRRVNIVQGEFEVSRDPDVVLTTLLGSCVAACIQDPVARVGGMNHFLLAQSDTAGASEHLRYGVHSMELLINGLLKLGARRENLQVWLFGGARLLERVTDIGATNAAFAETFVQREELTLAGSSLRGSRARRVQFWPVSGRVRQLALAKADPITLAPPPRPRVPVPVPSDDVDFF